MNQEETRKILSVYRPEDRSDPALAQAAEEAARDPALSAWLGKEQEFDRRFSQALQSAAIPPGLKARVLAGKEAAARQRLPGNGCAVPEPSPGQLRPWPCFL